MRFTFEAEFGRDLQARIDDLAREQSRLMEQAISEEIDYAAAEFKQRIREQTAMPEDLIEDRVVIIKNESEARIIASGEPVTLEHYPHRAVPGGVEVIINPGQVTLIKGARISRHGYIIFFEPGGTVKTLYGPSPDQIARTEFPEIADQARQNIRERLSRIAAESTARLRAKGVL